MAIAMPPIEPICRSRIGQIGSAVGDHIGDGTPVAAHGEHGGRAAERSGDLVDDPVGVGGEQDVHSATLPVLTGETEQNRPASSGAQAS